MIDHVSIAVKDLTASTAFYQRVLAPLGMTLLVERSSAAGFGKRYPEFWLNARPAMAAPGEDTGAHVCLRTPSEDAVRAFHAAGVDGGGRCDGAPGMRTASTTDYFAAFIRDPDGNRIEAAAFPSI